MHPADSTGFQGLARCARPPSTAPETVATLRVRCWRPNRRPQRIIKCAVLWRYRRLTVARMSRRISTIRDDAYPDRLDGLTTEAPPWQTVAKLSESGC